jgi:hypothetical protein
MKVISEHSPQTLETNIFKFISHFLSRLRESNVEIANKSENYRQKYFLGLI